MKKALFGFVALAGLAAAANAQSVSMALVAGGSTTLFPGQSVDVTLVADVSGVFGLSTFGGKWETSGDTVADGLDRSALNADETYGGASLPGAGGFSHGAGASGTGTLFPFRDLFGGTPVGANDTAAGNGSVDATANSITAVSAGQRGDTYGIRGNYGDDVSNLHLYRVTFTADPDNSISSPRVVTLKWTSSRVKGYTSSSGGTTVDLNKPVVSIDITIVPIPAPGAAALVAMGGLVAARRRRA